MKKIVCGCGGASFIRLQALFDTTEDDMSKGVMIVEKVFAYKCNQCGNEYTDDEIENFVMSSMNDDLDEKFVKIYREHD